MRHLDLFSGIGGFALAAREVWGEAHEIVGFCDNDSFCQNVLAKNFPGVPIYGDIRELTADRLAADAIGSRARLEVQDACGQKRQSSDASSPTLVRQRNRKNDAKGIAASHRARIDLLTGGFPCQPFSNAGKKRGDKDDRYLWPEMLRVIRETKPTWIIGENVAGIVRMALDQVCADLEGEGYAVQPFIIPAAAVGAPHRRDRVWIVARRGSDRERKLQSQGGEQAFGGRPGHANSNASDSARGRLRQEPANAGGREPGAGAEGDQRLGSALRSFQRSEWGRDWREVALETCHDGVDDGVPKRMARLPDGSEISEAALRRESLKAYGNAIVPQVAVEIMRAIKVANHP